MKRRQLLAWVGSGAGMMIMHGKTGIAQEPSGANALSRNRAAVSDRALALSDFPALEFRTALPDGLEWFKGPEPVADFDESGLFTQFDRVWLGYAPEDRERLEVTIYCARIVPERVAVAPDYARLLARLWGPMNYGVYGDERDFGEVMTGEDESGYARRTRISVWRRGVDVLIVRADTTHEDFDAQAPKLAAMIGSLDFVTQGADAIIAGLEQHQLRLPSGATVSYPLPAHWQDFDATAKTESPVSAAIWLDGADDGGNSAIGIFGAAVPEGAMAADAPLRTIASAMSDLLMQNLAPQAQFRRQPLNETRMQGFAADALRGMYLDRLVWDEGRQMGARSFFVVTGRDVVGYSSLSAYPETLEAMALAMHSTFVDRLIVDAIRHHTKKAAK